MPQKAAQCAAFLFHDALAAFSGLSPMLHCFSWKKSSKRTLYHEM
jgi:hypothetical protein